MKVRVTDQAVADLKEIWNFQYDTSLSAEVADSTVNTIRKDIRSLGEKPSGGHRRPDLTDLNLMFLRVFSYLVVFRSTPSDIEVIAVFHMARNIAELLDDRA